MLTSTLTLFLNYNHGLSDQDHIRMIKNPINPLNYTDFYVKVLNSSALSLYYDKALTKFVTTIDGVDITATTSDSRFILLDKTTIIYTEQPQYWNKFSYPITWINNISSTATWVNSGTPVNWINTA